MIVTRKAAEEALTVLRIASTPETVEESEVTSAFRAVAKGAHPDAGGSVEAFATVDRAKHVLLEWLKRRPTGPALPHHGEKCERCDGKGYVMSHRAFRSMRVQCPSCRGTGEIGVEHEKGDNW